MAMFDAERAPRRRSGSYLAIAAAAYVSLFLGALIAEQIDVASAKIDLVLLAVPALALVAAGIAAGADDAREFFTVGRNVPAFLSGLSLSVTTLGGVGFVCVTGALFMIGVDALPLLIAWVSGLVVASVMLFPFVRKCGAYTVPGFIGLRLDSRAARMLSALLLSVPMVLLLAAELAIAAGLLAGLTGTPRALCAVLVTVLAAATVVTGGMRALTWVTVAQSFAAALAMAVPATITSLLISNMPVPQIMHGIVVRTFAHLEGTQIFPVLHAGALEFSLPGAALEPLSGPYIQAFGHTGRIALPLTVMIIATGLAALPSVLNRAGTTPSVYETRKAVGWAVLDLALALLTLAAIAGFLRGYLDDQVVGARVGQLPQWFQALRQSGLADISKTRGAISAADILFRRDATIIGLPTAAGLPRVLVDLAVVGAMAAALAAASAHLNALAGMLSDDLVHGGRREPPDDRVRLQTARLATAPAAGLALVATWLISDPLAVALAALGLVSATIFPVLVLSILWRKVSREAVVLGMLSGFGLTATLMLASFAGIVSGTPLLAAALGGPLNLIVMWAVSETSPLLTRRGLETVHDLRIPGGEAIYDREMRLLRRKRAKPSV